MAFLRNIVTGLRSLFRKEQVDRELDEELRLYHDMAAEEKMKDGVSLKEALRAVRLERGSLEVSKEIVRSGGWESLVETCWQDLRFATRTLRKSAAFTAVAVLTLTLGIGATASIFSVVDAVLVRRLPYRNPSRLVSLYEDRSSTGFHRRQFTPANFADCKAQTAIFEDVAAIDADRSYNLTGNAGAPERLSAEGVTHNLFSILGVQPVLGRLFLPEEDTAGSEHVVLLSYRLWLSRFGGDRNVVGETVLLNDEKYSVVGVMPPWFSFPNKDADLWVPTAFTPQQLADRGAHFLTIIAALQPGVGVAQANAQLRILSQNLRQQHMDIMRFVDGFVAIPLAGGLHPRRARRTHRTPSRRRVHSVDCLRQYREPLAFARHRETTRDRSPHCPWCKSWTHCPAVVD
jgi:putative ABC transport system permease protein